MAKSVSHLQQTMFTIITRFLGKGANFIVFAILARALPIADWGVYGFIFYTSLIFATMLEFGFRNSNAYFIGKDEEHMGEYARASLFMFGIFTVLAVIVVPIFHRVQSMEMPYMVVIWPTILNTVALLFMRMQQGIFIGTGRIAVFNRTEMVPRVVILSSVVLLLLVDQINLVTALYALALGNIAGAIAVGLAIWPIAMKSKSTDFGVAKMLLYRGFLFMLSSIAMLVGKQIAFLIISQFGSEGQAGLFYGVKRLTEILTEVGLAIAVVLFSRSVRSERSEDAIPAIAYSTRISFAFFAVVSVLSIAFADVVVPVALGSKYVGYENLFRVLLLGTLAGTIWTIIYPNLAALATPLLAFSLFVPNLALGGLVTYVLYQYYGMAGAAWGMVIAQTALSISFLVVFKIKFNAPILSFVLISREEAGQVFGKLKTKILRRK